MMGTDDPDGSGLIFEGPLDPDIDAPSPGVRTPGIWDEIGEDLMALTGGREVRAVEVAARAAVLSRDEDVPRVVLEALMTGMEDPAQAPRCGGLCSVKMAVTGPFQAGMSSLIASLSDIPVLSTTRPAENPDALREDQRTVSLEFGRMTVTDELMLYFYGAAGWQRTFFPWSTLAEGMIGLIIVVDGTSAASIAEAAKIKKYFDESAEVRCVVAVNRVSPSDTASVAAVRGQMGIDADVPVVACDVRDRDSLKPVVRALLRRILHTMP